MAIDVTYRPIDELGVLSQREREVAALVADGLSNKEIANRLVVTIWTIKSHVENAMSKTGAINRAQLAYFLGLRYSRWDGS